MLASSVGEELLSAEMKAEAFRIFAAPKFEETEREQKRPEMADLGPPEDRAEDTLSDEELEIALKAMKKRKAVGPDMIPIELYQLTDMARMVLACVVMRELGDAI